MASKTGVHLLLSAYLIALFTQGCGGDSSLGVPNTTGNAGITTTGSTTGGGTTTGNGSTTGGTSTGISGSPGTTGGTSATAKAYRGSATVTLGPEGSAQAFSTRVVVTTDRPLQYRGRVEENPFSLTVLPETSSGSASPQDGQFTFYSALLNSGTSGATSSLLQCWKMEQSGSNLTGRLIDNHHLTTDVNTVNVPTEISPGLLYPWASLMSDEMTTLTGTMDDHSVQLKLEGKAAARGTLCPFVIQIEASR